MILVTGATGVVGRLVLDGLPVTVEARVLTRDPSKVAPRRRGVEVVQGDYGDEPSLAAALRGVRRALLVTNRVGGTDDAAFLRAARRAGVGQVVKVSSAAVLDAGATDAVTRWQRRSEQEVRASSLRWTLLRPRSFMTNTLAWADGVRAEGVVRALHGISANAGVDPRDVAAVAVLALTENGHEGRSYTLTGPEAISAVQQTELIGRAVGRRLEFVELTAEQARSALLRRHPPEVAEALLQSAGRQLAGAKVGVEPMVERLTGRPATPFRTWAVDHAARFRAA
ncbi:NAD(P)H-binding protein [Streptomyces sp. NPDC047315]|uniref:NAD(P)H-binding protein n=1 Tax=Streptomyces sp. NPDC047315 TaxID=3155142 RepID=UPI0033D3B648